MAKLLLVGCGKMGSAMLVGWIAQGTAAADVCVVEPHGADVPDGVTVLSSADDLDPAFIPDVCILAVKPQVMDDVLGPYARFADTGTTYLSIAAGRTIASFAAILGEGAAIVRAMPNTPAAVGRGISVCCPNGHVSADARTLCDGLLTSVGQVEWVEDEGLMDAVTAVSGSGPAYIFLLAEAMGAAGVAAGLPQDLSQRLARATVAGSGELLHQSPLDAATLRENVTSPGGTTAAALDVLMASDGMTELLTRAIIAATDRSKELARG